MEETSGRGHRGGSLSRQTEQNNEITKLQIIQIALTQYLIQIIIYVKSLDPGDD